ncbi:unnamed protein product [Haemonchus placei]|uniref:Uncharacterized protein n=1 Tax=Haemonchus placei TaxID=6290 RepID=A0A3P7T4G9_HAEPC|nr:unnamed protein product [Haemonchus placei]
MHNYHNLELQLGRNSSATTYKRRSNAAEQLEGTEHSELYRQDKT